MAKEKQCTKCKETLSIFMFFRNRTSKDGFHWWCKSCSNTSRNEWRSRDPEHARRKDAEWAVNNESKRTGTRLMTYYGLSTEDRAILGDHCMVCGVHTNVVIDHDHSCCSGIRSCGFCVRGVLCSKCNLALGHFGDSVDKLTSAIKYIEAFKDWE